MARNEPRNEDGAPSLHGPLRIEEQLRSIGARLRQRREHQELTLREVADRTRTGSGVRGISPAHISRIERAEVTVDLKELAVICNALRCELRDVLEPSVKPWYMTPWNEIVQPKLAEVRSGTLKIERTDPAHEYLIDRGKYKYVPLTDETRFAGEREGTIDSPLMQKSVFIIEAISDEDMTLGLDQHWGEEIIHVLDGEVICWFAQSKPDAEAGRIKKIHLKPRDCLHYTSQLLHGFTARGNEAIALFVYSDATATPVTFRAVNQKGHGR